MTDQVAIIPVNDACLPTILNSMSMHKTLVSEHYIIKISAMCSSGQTRSLVIRAASISLLGPRFGGTVFCITGGDQKKI
jgi:hypothetical protein